MDTKYKDSKFIFVVGIGGSNAAAKAVYSALRLEFFEGDSNLPRIIFIEILSDGALKGFSSFVQNNVNSKEEFYLFVISKSGKTTETLKSFSEVLNILENKFKNIGNRVSVISEENSPLAEIAGKKNFEFIKWPEGVGGRFSAFGVPHTLPISAGGMDAEEYLKSKDDVNKELVSTLAVDIFKNYKEGIKILDLFLFDSRLENLGKWFRQLIAESLGKTNEDGDRVGITPTVSVAPADLHSVLQLYLGGPKDRFTIFAGTNPDSDLLQKIRKEIINAYKERGLPHLVYEMEKINERSIGRFFADMMATVVKLGELLRVDVFDQPEVDEYKLRLNNN